jgi:hypothetical protein
MGPGWMAGGKVKRKKASSCVRRSGLRRTGRAKGKMKKEKVYRQHAGLRLYAPKLKMLNCFIKNYNL